MERTLMIVKPDGVEKGLVGSISKMIIDKGLIIEKQFIFKFNKRIAKEFYRELYNAPFFLYLIKFITSRPVKGFIIKGENAVLKVREMVGKRYPPSGIRGKYANEIIGVNNYNLVKNIVHGSDSVEEARREIQLVSEIIDLESLD